MKTIEMTITDFTKSEFSFLADMIQEKLADNGHDNVESFSFDLIVRFDREEHDET
jgi:hypothetical protein